MGCCAGRGKNTYYSSKYSTVSSNSDGTQVVTVNNRCGITHNELMSLYKQIRKTDLPDSLKRDFRSEIANMTNSFKTQCPDLIKVQAIRDAVGKYGTDSDTEHTDESQDME